LSQVALQQDRKQKHQDDRSHILISTKNHSAGFLKKYRHFRKYILRLVCKQIDEILKMSSSIDKVQRPRYPDTVKFAVCEDGKASKKVSCA